MTRDAGLQKRPKSMNLEDQLVDASKKGDLKRIRACLEQGAVIHSENVYGYPEMPLCEAARNGRAEAVKLLLEKGAKIHAGDWVLKIAAKGGHTETVEILLKEGVYTQKNYDDALCEAASNGHTETVGLLLNRSSTTDAEKKDRALKYAAGEGHTETVRLLLNHGANIHAESLYEGPEAALKSAAKNKHIETAKVLLEKYPTKLLKELKEPDKLESLHPAIPLIEKELIRRLRLIRSVINQQRRTGGMEI